MTPSVGARSGSKRTAPPTRSSRTTSRRIIAEVAGVGLPRRFHRPRRLATISNKSTETRVAVRTRSGLRSGRTWA